MDIETAVEYVLRPGPWQSKAAATGGGVAADRHQSSSEAWFTGSVQLRRKWIRFSPPLTITPPPQYYGAVRPWLAHRYLRPHGSTAWAFSLNRTNQVLKFRTKARIRLAPALHRTPQGQ